MNRHMALKPMTTLTPMMPSLSMARAMWQPAAVGCRYVKAGRA